MDNFLTLPIHHLARLVYLASSPSSGNLWYTALPVTPHPIRFDTGSSLVFTENDNEDNTESLEITLSKSLHTSPHLYHIEYDNELSLYKAVFHRDADLHSPGLDETYNFRFFSYCRKNDENVYQDSELIIGVKRFYGMIKAGILDLDREFVLMRWGLGYDYWTASKYNRYPAREFLKSHVFINCLLSKSSRGMHYEEDSIKDFR